MNAYRITIPSVSDLPGDPTQMIKARRFELFLRNPHEIKGEVYVRLEKG
jgi:hypothetical protein